MTLVASCAKVGADATIESVIPWMLVTTGGIGCSGFTSDDHVETFPSGKNAGGRNLYDSVASWPDAGRFQVDTDERSRQSKMGGEFLSEALDIHDVVFDRVDMTISISKK